MITTIENKNLSVKIASLGAQLNSISLNGREYLWQGDPKWWPRRAPVLFPIVGSLRGGEAESAAGTCRMGRHGLARNLEHKILRQTAEAVTYELTSIADTLEQYPYDFCLCMTYRITAPGTLENRFAVTNTGKHPMPFVLGGHPAFQVPAGQAEGEAFEDYELRFTKEMTCTSPVLVGEDGLLDFTNQIPVLHNASVLPLSHRLFDHDALVFEQVPNNTITLIGGKSEHGVRVDFPGFDYLGVWSAAGDAPFVALEPWTGCSTATDEDNCFEHKRGMRSLAPGKTAEYAFSISVF